MAGGEGEACVGLALLQLVQGQPDGRCWIEMSWYIPWISPQVGWTWSWGRSRSRAVNW